MKLYTGPELTVYFVTARGVGRVKVGYSKFPPNEQARRFLSPVPLVLEASTPGARVVERWFHERYREHRGHGEWFDIAPIIEDDIRQLATGGRIPGQPVEPIDRTKAQIPSGLLQYYREHLFGWSTSRMAAALGVDVRAYEAREKPSQFHSAVQVAHLDVLARREGHPVTAERVFADAEYIAEIAARIQPDRSNRWIEHAMELRRLHGAAPLTDGLLAAISERVQRFINGSRA